MKGMKIIEGALDTLQFFFYFPANGSTNPDVFQPKTFPIPRGIIPQNFSSLGFAVSEELGNKQTHKLTHILLLQKKDYLQIGHTLMYAILQCMEYIKEKDGKYFSSFSPSPLSFIALQDGIGFLTKDVQFLCNLLT